MESQLNNKHWTITDETIKYEDFIKEANAYLTKNPFIPTSLYIHSPFCVSPCDYCIFEKKPLCKNIELYKHHYTTVLPKQLDEISNFSIEHPFDIIHWGGGTPNLMSVSQYEDVVSHLCNYNKALLNEIEVHAAYLSPAFERILLRDFNRISFGLQSFNKEVLNFNKRAYIEPERLKDILSKCSDKKIETSVDMLTFIRNRNPEDLSILANDIAKVIECGPSRINLCANIEVVRNHSDEEKWLTYLKSLILAVKGIYQSQNTYSLSSDFPDIFNPQIPDEALSQFFEHSCNFVFVKKDTEMRDFLPHYNSSHFAVNHSNQLVMAAGGVTEIGVFSYIPETLHITSYYEPNASDYMQSFIWRRK